MERRLAGWSLCLKTCSPTNQGRCLPNGSTLAHGTWTCLALETSRHMSTHVPFASLCPAGLIQSTRALLSSLHAPHGILPSSSVNPSSISIHVLFLRRGSTRINLSQIRACAAQSASYFTSSLFD